jgi:hypothetical protein
MRLERRDEFERSEFVEYCDIIHTRKARENLCPFLLGEDGTPGTFQALNRAITVYPDDQYIPQRFGLLQITDMAEMEKVETTVGKDNPLPFLFEVLDCFMEYFFGFDLFFQFLSPYFKNYQI